MIIDNLKGRCVDIVARRLAGPIYGASGRKGDAAYFEILEDQKRPAIEVINAATNMQLLDLIADVLAEDGP